MKRIKDDIKRLGLKTPMSFWEIDDASLAMMTNGCGPGGLLDLLIPDDLFGLDIKPCCVIHDWDYITGRTKDDKKLADRRFLDNMLITIEHDGDGDGDPDNTLLGARRAAAMTYYTAVADCGDSFFKNATLS